MQCLDINAEELPDREVIHQDIALDPVPEHKYKPEEVTSAIQNNLIVYNECQYLMLSLKYSTVCVICERDVLAQYECLQ